MDRVTRFFFIVFLLFGAGIIIQYGGGGISVTAIPVLIAVPLVLGVVGWALYRILEWMTSALERGSGQLPSTPAGLAPDQGGEPSAMTPDDQRNRDADTIRGTAVRLMAAGGGQEVVATKWSDYRPDDLEALLDPVMAAADRAGMAVHAERVKRGVRLSVAHDIV